MEKIPVDLGAHSYDIYIGEALLCQTPALLSRIYSGKRLAVVTDSNVYSLYGKILGAALEQSGYEVLFVRLPPGEQSKSLEQLNFIYSRLLQGGISRSDMLLALGGGVIGDIAGFASATYMRGIPYVQLPTSLLAQIDSSIGGKTAVNLEAGKNLAGCFYQPRAVYIDPSLLQTLPQEEYRNGLGEIIKYGAIKSAGLLDRILATRSFEELQQMIPSVIGDCCTIKKELVQQDELDQGDRQLLNFGHTLGHAIESYFEYKGYKHGEAVALGMLQITKNSEAMGLTLAGAYGKLLEAVKLCGLPFVLPSLDADRILELAGHDKKSQEALLKLILLKEPGSAFIHPIPKNRLNQFIL
jgi:3-dehydroquinate synthase